MKKISLMVCFVLAGLIMQAQKINLGLKGGLNLATWSADGSGVNYENRVGFHGGLLAQIHVSPQFAIQPEVVYSSQGTKYNIGAQEHNLQLNYVNIPLMLQAKLGGGLYAQAGPQIGFLTSVSDEVDNVETGFFDKSDFKDNDVALGFGLGYQSVGGIGVDARYNLGLTDINNVGNNNIKNNVLQVGLFIKLR